MGRAKMVMVTVLLMVVMGGCDGLRFAPGERQKQNAYLHQRTVRAAATRAVAEDSSEPLKQLTQRADLQSEAIMAYYGLPRELPAAESVEQLLSEENEQLSRQARTAAMERPDPWQAAEGLLELGLALAGVVGGVYGTRAVKALQLARQKSQALREIVTGSEIFKRNNPDSATAFKDAQQMQSPPTRSLVAAVKVAGAATT